MKEVERFKKYRFKQGTPAANPENPEEMFMPLQRIISRFKDIQTNEDFMLADVHNFSIPDKKLLQSGSEIDLKLTGMTCLFMSSKNTEVEPISLGDLSSCLLDEKYKPD